MGRYFTIEDMESTARNTFLKELAPVNGNKAGTPFSTSLKGISTLRVYVTKHNFNIHFSVSCFLLQCFWSKVLKIIEN